MTRKTYFRFMLPPSRLGTAHDSLGSFRAAVAAEATKKMATKESSGETHSDLGHQTKEYTLIVVTTHDVQRVLLGLKHRGFGTGLYNSFGGKVEAGDESLSESARRELREETGIALDLGAMKNCHLGTLFFTFEDSATEMVVHLFHVRIRTASRLVGIGPRIPDGPSSSSAVGHVAGQDSDENGDQRDGDNGENSNGAADFPHVDPGTIRGCDEITPFWFETRDIPLHNMFADDSVWLTQLLLEVQMMHQQQRQQGQASLAPVVALDGWFHFAPGGAEVNTVLHYHLDLRQRSTLNEEAKENSRQSDLDRSKLEAFGLHGSPSTCGRDARHQPLTLEKRLFHELHRSGVNSPRLKEYNEAYAFVNALRLSANKIIDVELVLDVAGGHGALGALFLITTPTVRRAVVIDPAMVGNGAVERAWRPYWTNTKDPVAKELRYRHECLRTGLPSELDQAIAIENVDPANILVVACHACQHLSDEILETSLRYGVQVAVMPCCQRDPTQGCNWKAASKNLGLPIPVTMDLLLAGKAVSWGVGSEAGVTYDVRLRTINSSITPQNRIIFCRPSGPEQGERGLFTKRRAHAKLEQAYKKAHKNATCTPTSRNRLPIVPSAPSTSWLPCWASLGIGFASGVVTCLVLYFVSR